MTDSIIEKRRYTRVFFSGREKICGTISMPGDTSQTYPIIVFNLSEGGLQISLTRADYRASEPGDSIMLRQLTGVPLLEPVVDVPMQIKWVMDNEYLDNVIMGGVFVGLTSGQRKALQCFVSECLAVNMGDEG